MLRKYLLSVCAILSILLSGCGAQDDSVKDIDTVLQSKEEIRNSNEMTEDFNGQEATNAALLLFYDDSSADKTYIYKDVLEQYQDMVQNDFYKNLTDSDNYDSSFGEAIGLEIRLHAQDIYYALYDIDGNGTAELIIAGGERRYANADNSPWNYDLYGYDGTNVVHIFSDMEFGYRTNFSLYENGVIEVSHTDSAAESGVDFYKIGNDGFTPEKIDSFAVVGHLEGDTPVFDYLQNGNEITEDEYNANIQSYEIDLARGLHWIQIQ